MKKRSGSSRCSAGSEGSGSGLKVWDAYNKNWRKGKGIKALRTNEGCNTGGNLLVSGQTTKTNTVAKSTEKDSEIKSLSKGTSEISEQARYLNMNYLQRDFPARVFPLRENARVFRTKQGELFSTKYAELLEVKNLATYSLRMLKDFFLTTEAEPSRSYSFRWMSLGTMSNGRCLTLSIGCPRTVKGSLSSVLEDEVDKKYYLKQKMIQKMINKEDGLIQVGNVDQAGHNSIWGRVYSPEGLASNINADGGGLGAKTGLYNVIMQLPRGKNKGGIKEKMSPTISASVFEHNNLLIANTVDRDGYLRRGTRDKDKDGKAILTSIPKRRIRRLMPRECERLQGFPDDWTRVPAIGNDAGIAIASHPEDRDEIIKGKIMSDTQRYKMMGNAVSIPVIEAIGRKILERVA